MEGLKHSGLGIASFISTIVSGSLLFLVIMMSISASDRTDPVEDSGIGLVMVAFCLVLLLALGLGIGGLLQKQRKKIFAILGTLFSVATIILILITIAWGFL